jgi:hypothetical protein
MNHGQVHVNPFHSFIVFNRFDPFLIHFWSIFDPQGLGFGQKFALLERGWSRSKPLSSAPSRGIPWHPVAKSGLETAANGLVKEANLDFARTWRRQVTYGKSHLMSLPQLSGVFLDAFRI